MNPIPKNYSSCSRSEISGGSFEDFLFRGHRIITFDFEGSGRHLLDNLLRTKLHLQCRVW